MMKSKQIISLSAAAIMAMSVAAVAGCKEDPAEKPVQLSAPVITLTGNEISWTAVEHADSYVVKESTTEVSTQTALTYTIDKTEAGTYTYTVTATSSDKKYSASAASNSVTYTVAPQPAGFEGKIYLVGDSTVCAFDDPYYMPRYGYGTQLHNYLNCEENQIVNLALSGRSSLSFTYGLNVDDKNKNELTGELSCYEYLTQNIAAGDYLIIGFGHNDEKKEDPARYTNPTKTHTDATTENGPSFQYILNEKYIKVAKEKGATPVLCTPIVRYNANAEKYDQDSGHITAEGDYPAAIKALGTATETTVIDLTAITKADYIDKGAEALRYHAFTTYDDAGGEKVPAGEDKTHLNYYGAKMVAYEFATALKTSTCALKDLVKADIAAPTEADYDKAIKTDYEKAGYMPFNPESYEDHYLGEVAGQSWYKTVYGSMGGLEKIPAYKTELAGGKFTVGCDVGNGKFAGSEYGFAAAFIQIDESKNFTASAEVKIITRGTGVSNQSGFGMMVSDSIYIDTDDKTINHNCIIAGGLEQKGFIFSYTGGKQNKPSGDNALSSLNIAEGATYTITITKVEDTFTVTVNDGTNTYTQEYPDFDYYTVDEHNVYLSLVANRGIVAEFSNVQVSITG